MQNVRKNLRRLPILGRKMHQPIPTAKTEIKSHSFEPNMQIKMEWICPEIPPEPNINLYCRECEDLQDYEVIECIENGNVVHRYKMLKLRGYFSRRGPLNVTLSKMQKLPPLQKTKWRNKIRLFSWTKHYSHGEM